jgi:hypothetical protein
MAGMLKRSRLVGDETRIVLGVASKLRDHAIHRIDGQKILQILTLVDILVQLALFKEFYRYIDASLDCPCR